ncbi:hypothetical protein [Treponema endosymbiont of Eucomonympha sp.]|uniref:hypothetical protein n=1 Tax=Treponema endosymbiont of Eucomonympha sp. TaxID=1580831 RepID=UPI0007514FAF|nr:hypothetical protein [Treponema endosymbiont of Eucomonympha sp.]
MSINSIKFLLFFCIVFFIYYFPLKEKTRAQNILLLLASYIFYGIANWKMIPLLIAVTVIFYGLGILIGKFNVPAPREATLATVLGACLGVGLLLFFKYLNFFITSFSDLFSMIGLHTNWNTFNIILPAGVSFFTFKLISYMIEIYRRHIEPETSIITFAAYVAFFPTMMAGPIDRPNAFIPQLQKTRALFDYALAVDAVWDNIPGASGINLIIVAFLYPIQAYADLSSYSDLAIGGGKILRFR